MEWFDPALNAAISHVHLLEQAVGSGATLQAYMCCATRQQQTKIFCVHLPTKVTSALTGEVTLWDGQIFAYLGELLHGTVTTVQLPVNIFCTITVAVTKTSKYMITHLEELTTDGFPPCTANDEEATDITTRRLMYFPPCYVPILLDPAGYTLQETWQFLYLVLDAVDDLGNCGALLKWLRTASTSSAAANGMNPSTAILDLQAPLANHTLITNQNNLLRQILLALQQPTGSLEAALSKMVTAVLQNTNENHLAQDEKRARDQAPKLPSDHYTSTLNILLEYLRIPDERNVPSLWHQWANSTKQQDFQVLSEALYAYTRSPEAFNNCAPVVTAKLVQDLQSFLFVGDSMDDLKSGLHSSLLMAQPNIVKQT